MAEQLMFDIVTERVNYLVHCFYKAPVPCETEGEAWKAIGQLHFGAPYWVTSPTGMSIDDFIPF